MPTLSASDYTTYLKFKAAAASPIRPNIQTRDNVAVSQAVINARPRQSGGVRSYAHADRYQEQRECDCRATFA